MIEVLVIALKVLVVLLAFGGLMYLADKYVSSKMPAPASPWAQIIIGLVLLILAVAVLMEWAFGVSLRGLGALPIGGLNAFA